MPGENWPIREGGRPWPGLRCLPAWIAAQCALSFANNHRGHTFMLKDLAKLALRRTGLREPIKRWANANADVPFHTLSPDLLVGLVRAFDRQKSYAGRAYYEFGLYQGFSIWFAEQISRGRVPDDFRLLGFDSFAGLPASDVDSTFFGPGDYAVSYEDVTANLTEFKADFDRVSLFKGFYSNELFATIERRENLPAVAIAVIDVDIYESCVVVLDFLRPRLEVGSILIFDDYNDMQRSDDHGERKALREFMDRTGMELTELFELGRECAGFEVTRAPS
jgi:Macrocin-O-methyltransferase (TylF)